MWDPRQEKVWKPRVLLFFDFSACRCQKKSIVYETECKRVAVQRSKQNRNCLYYSTEPHTSNFILSMF